MQQSGEKEIKLNQEFKLRYQEQAIIRSEELIIKFLALLEDSRCPVNVDCIWEGNGKIQIGVKKNSGEFKTFVLNTNLEPLEIMFENYKIKIVSLDPKPKSEAKNKAESYIATFLIWVGLKENAITY
jgi:hypothetical protein